MNSWQESRSGIEKSIREIRQNLQTWTRFSAIERDILLERLRKLYAEIEQVSLAPAAADPVSVESPAPGVASQTPKFAPDTPELAPVPQEVPAKPSRAPASLQRAKANEPLPAGESLVFEKFAKERKADLSEKLGQAPISNLRREIDLNDQYWFIQELFGGDNEGFRRTLKKIDLMENHDQAVDYLRNEVRGPFKWEKKPQIEQKFMELVERRFEQGLKPDSADPGGGPS